MLIRIAFLLPVFVFWACAQSTQATLSGRIVDSLRGRPVAAAQIRYFTDSGQGLAISSNRLGWYVIGGISPGTLRLEVSAPGFQPQQVEHIELPVSGSVDLDFRLRPLSDVWEAGLTRSLLPQGTRAVLHRVGLDLDASQTARPRLPQIRDGAFEPSRSDVITTAQLRSLPLAGRDAYTLVIALSGVTADAGTSRGLGVSVHGQRPSSSSFRLDGVDNNNDLVTGPLVTLPPEALSEYRLSAGIFTAEFGGTSGLLANAISLGEQRAWHGLLYLYGNHESLNANTFQRNRQGWSRAADVEWQPGWSLGGPLAKGVFLTSAGELQSRRTQEDPGEYLLPAAQYSRYLIAGGAGRGLLDRFRAPFPETRFVNAPVMLSPDASTDRKFLLTRLDRTEGRLHQMLRWMTGSYSRPDFVWSPYRDFYSELRQPTHSVVASIVGDWKPGLQYDGRVHWNRQSLGWNRPYAEIPTLESFDGTILPGSPAFYAFDYRQQRWESNHFVAWLHGGHQWKMGGSGMVRTLHTAFAPGRDGRLSFNSYLADFGYGQPNTVDLLVNRRALPQIETVNGPQSFRQLSANWFLQDSWRVNSRLMLHLGARYEFSGSPSQTGGPAVETLDLGARLDVRDAHWRVPGAAGLLPVDRNDWAARTGLSWRLDERGRTFLRASYGIFYDRIFDNLWQNLALNALTLRTASVDSSSFMPRSALPSARELLARNRSVDLAFPEALAFSSNLNTPFVRSYSLGLRRELSEAWQVDTALIGASGRSLLTTDKYNRNFSEETGRRNPLLPVINYRANQGVSDFHAFSLRTRYRKDRWTAQASYTWSHAIDNQSDALSGDFFDLSFSRQNFQANAAGAAAFSIQGDGRGDRATADFDQRHNLAAWCIAELPGGWQIAAMGAVRSGFPYSVYAPAGSAPLLYNRRADLASTDVNRNTAGDGGRQLLRPEAFAEPAPGMQGNLGRNSFAGPGLFNIDVSLSRSFRLSRGNESRRALFRADAFNFLNHANLQPPSNQLGASDFGFATYGRQGRGGFPGLAPFRETGRRIQLMLQVYF